MTDYLNWEFKDSPASVGTFDELPLWSAPFGMLLLKNVGLKRGLKVLDIGSGAGFPLFEIAQRLGPSSQCIGIDCWTNANARAREKVINYGCDNVSIIDCSATSLPFENSSIDLIVSNLGINNFDDPITVFKECSRVLKSGGKLAITTNLNGHWNEFYRAFEATLLELRLSDIVPKLKQHEEHRGSVESIGEMFAIAGLQVEKTVTDSFEMRFLDGTAFFNHYFIKLGWMSSWKNMIPAEQRIGFFSHLEQRLNDMAQKSHELLFTVPMAFIEGVKP